MSTRREPGPQQEALVAVLVEVAMQRAWLHDDPASYRAGVLALRDALQQGDEVTDGPRLLDATG